MPRIFHVYLLTNRPNGTTYCGVTNDLAARIAQHRAGQTGSFSTRYNLRRLVWAEAHDDPDEAIRREKCIKKWRRAWKVRLIEEQNPTWRDLLPDPNQARVIPAKAGTSLR